MGTLGWGRRDMKYTWLWAVAVTAGIRTVVQRYCRKSVASGQGGPISAVLFYCMHTIARPTSRRELFSHEGWKATQKK